MAVSGKAETGMRDTATIILEGKSYELPVVRGTEGEKAVDISGLRKASGFVTLDRGYENTGSCRSAITFIDGEKSILRYRGYSIEDLAEHSTFTEVAYLLLYGELPTAGQLEEFSTFLNESSLIHEDMLHFFLGFPAGSHPMGILATTVASLSTFYPIPELLDGKAERQILANLISQVRTIAAISYKKSIGEPIVYPSYKLRYVPNFLTMMFSSPVKDYRLDEDIVRAIDLFFILHADHEQNCSTSTVRMTGSSLANVYAVISAGISALWGPRHGGANQAVITMLQQILAEGGDGSEFIRRAKDRNCTDRLMGFGHRVLQELRSPGRHTERALPQAPEQAGHDGPPAGHRPAPRGDRAEGRLLPVAQPLPERGFLLGTHPARRGHTLRHVHRALRDRPHAGMAGTLARDVSRRGLPHGPAPAICTGYGARAWVPREKRS